jgi:hypothetical protein
VERYMTCNYCGKASCRHQGEAGREKIASGSRRSDDQPSPAQPLFAMTDLRELLCVLCSKVIAAGRNQTYERAYHGEKHVREGTAVADRHGLPAGAVRYSVKPKPTP